MSYQVLARKWRPQNFEQLVGQEHVLRALVNALENERLHHAYLFSGTRGVGKTTIARILARSLNCETGITAKPCGECASCQEISEGRFIDLIEVDAASRTKVEDTRDLLENVQYRPTRGRFKIYLIDEVHMLSNHSFNALLKTLEEPPEHVKFLLATTDPQKLPVTVLSRCLQFNLKNLPAARISEYLETVLNEEKVPFEKNALGHMARAAAGSMRDALSLTDQAISHGGGKLSEQDVVEMLGTVDRKRIYQLVHAIGEKNGADLIQNCQELAQYSVDYLALLEEMLALFHAIAVRQVVPEIDQSSFGDPEQVEALAAQMSQEDVQLSYQILLMGRKDLVASPDMNLGFEMLMLRLLSFQPDSPSGRGTSGKATQTDDQPATTSSSEEVVSAKKPEAAAKLKPQTSPATEATEDVVLSAEQNLTAPKTADLEETDQAAEEIPSAQTLSETQPENLAIPDTDQALSESSEQDDEAPPPWVVEAESESLTTQTDTAKTTASGDQGVANSPHPAPSKLSDSSTPAPTELEALNPDTWIALYRALPLDGVIKSVVGHMVLEEQNLGRTIFRLAESGQPLFNPNHQQRLADVLTAYFGHPVDVAVELGGVQRETPAECARRLHQEAISAAEKKMLADPLIGELIKEFQAELVPDSVTINNENT